jgi:hypothetical protein
LGAHGTTYRHCGFDQPLSSNSRFQNRVAGPRVRASPRVKQRVGNCRSDHIPLPRGRQFVTLKGRRRRGVMRALNRNVERTFNPSRTRDPLAKAGCLNPAQRSVQQPK